MIYDARRQIMSYCVGFFGSILLTLSAYYLVTSSTSGDMLLYLLAGLAMVQATVQLIFFLHLRDEAEPRWRLLVFNFMLLIITIVVFGSLWIMNNLQYHMMSQEADQYIMEEELIQR